MAIALKQGVKRFPKRWDWNTGQQQIREKNKFTLTQQKIFYALMLTSVFWLAMDILFLLHKQTPISVDKTRRSSSDLKASFTPPRKRHHRNLPVVENMRRNQTLRELVKIQKTRLGKLGVELYPDLIDPLLGAGGLPATIPSNAKELSNRLFKNHSFDSVLSDRMSLNRVLADVRGAPCVAKEYPSDLATTSVVICFHNEALSALLRTVHSVINNTPPHLLANIVLVDDASLGNLLKRPLMTYIRKLNRVLGAEKVVVYRNAQREGLVRSRLKGAELSTGQVLTFLDSHCEVTVGWVEPLLARITGDKSKVVCPVIEVIDAVDFSYKEAELERITQVGGFTWDLFFNWKEMSEDEKVKRVDFTQPLKSPTMAGGLFSIDKSYFYDIGSYDDQMDIWGGENLEMSFRIWMCGGSLEIVPCSRVGHIFRKENSPYAFPQGVSRTLAKNFNRLAETWMDEYKELYYRRKPAEDRKVDYGDISSRVSLRKRLDCKSFYWYIQNIIPDMIGADPNPPAHGEIRHNATGMCVDSMGNKGNRAQIKAFPCHRQGGNQFFVLSRRGELIFNDESCLDYSSENHSVDMWNCHGLGGNQEWSHDKNKGTIEHVMTSKCLTITDDDITVSSCDQDNNNIAWSFSNYGKTLWR